MATSTSTVVTNTKKPSILVTVAKKASTASGSLHHTRLSFSVPSRSLFGASSRKSINLHTDSKILDKTSPFAIKTSVKVWDEQGFDVTPRPLFHLEPGATIPKQSKIFAQDVSVLSTYDFISTASAQTAVNASFVGPFTRSTFGGATGSKSSRTESLTETVDEDGSRLDIGVSLSDIQVRREEVREHLNEQDLNNIVDVFLTETSTIWMFDLPPLFLSVDSEDAEKVKLRNEVYDELCKNRAGNDRYIERMMQTFGGAVKHKEVQCDRIVLNDAAIMATTWDLYDSTKPLESTSSLFQVDAKAGKRRSSATSSKSTASHTLGGSTTMMSKTSSSGTHSTIMDVEQIILARIPEDITQDDAAAVLNLEQFQDDLFFMERVLMGNNFQPKLAIYRQLPILTDPDVSVGVVVKKICPDTSTLSLNRLWSFACELTKGRNVSSTAWNRKNPDLLAVGYGQFGFKEQKGGLACCWSLKNPTWPERILNCESGVTALDFSAANPNLLAIGMYNGTVAIYNVQNNYATPVMDSSESSGKHTSPVWQLKWLDQEKCTFGEEKGELLVSVSGDGRITRWYMRKTLDCSDLMKLKRIGTERSKKSSDEREKKIEAFIFRRAPGMCFDFHPKDPNIYLAGTEEGHIHKCSCSYNEQFLETYRTHKGPVYKIAWSPFCQDVFLSCSADWNIHLWVEDRLKPVLTFSTVTTAVYEIMWSPYSAVVFGAVNETRVEIWDLHISTLDPVLVNVPNPGVTYTTILFAKNTNCVLIGDSDGHVGVYEMRNVCITETSQVEELNEIIATTLASQLQYEALG